MCVVNQHQNLAITTEVSLQSWGQGTCILSSLLLLLVDQTLTAAVESVSFISRVCTETLFHGVSCCCLKCLPYLQSCTETLFRGVSSTYEASIRHFFPLALYRRDRFCCQLSHINRNKGTEQSNRYKKHPEISVRAFFNHWPLLIMWSLAVCKLQGFCELAYMDKNLLNNIQLSHSQL